MSVAVDLDDLVEAFEWVSAGCVAGVDAEACIQRGTGKIYWCGEGIDEEPPEDIDDRSLYIAVPRKKDLGLGRSLALRFVDEYLPRSSATVRDYFGRRGAYPRFKTLLSRAGKLDAWHQYEALATEEALRGLVGARGDRTRSCVCLLWHFVR